MTAGVDVEVWRIDATTSGADARDRAGFNEVDAGYTNVAHTADLTVLARATVRVGIDVEVVRRRPYIEALARRTMTDDEWQAWRVSDDPTRAFLQHWTRVEAYLKAIGVGVRGGLRTRPGAGWTLIDLYLGPRHVGALAAEVGGKPVRVQWRVLDAGEHP